MSIKNMVLRGVGIVFLIAALSLPTPAQSVGTSTWETSAEKAERGAREAREKERENEREKEREKAEELRKAALSSFTDQRDGQKYKTARIGNTVWMAENLNHATDGSGCYKDDAAHCKKYGRLYKWESAKSACLGMGDGWRLPTREEWNSLAKYAGGAGAAGKKLKSKSGWNNNGNGLDDYGFTALPGGARGSDGRFRNVGDYGYFWSTAEGEAGSAYYRDMHHRYADVNEDYNDKSYGFSVRCAGGAAKE